MKHNGYGQIIDKHPSFFTMGQKKKSSQGTLYFILIYTRFQFTSGRKRNKMHS